MDEVKSVETIPLSPGDVIMFPSVYDHAVKPVKTGQRKVLVLEYWLWGRFEGWWRNSGPFESNERVFYDGETEHDLETKWAASIMDF